MFDEIGMFEAFGRLYGLLALFMVAEIVFGVFLMLAVGYDCKAKNNPKQSMWMLLTLFFGWIPAVIYYCTERNKPAQMNRCSVCGAPSAEAADFCMQCGNRLNGRLKSFENKKKSKIFLGCSVGALVVSIVIYICVIISTFSMMNGAFDFFENEFDTDVDIHYGYEYDGETVYYDRCGNLYYDSDDVLYYDENGTEYLYSNSRYSFESRTDTLDALYCYVDMQGFLVYDTAAAEGYAEPLILFDENADCFKDKAGNVYFDAVYISWDRNGSLVDSDNGEALCDFNYFKAS